MSSFDVGAVHKAVCFLLHKAGAAFRLCAMLVRDCTNRPADSPSPAVRTLGLSGNYPDGRTGNLPFIPSTRKSIAFAARTELFYMLERRIARRIFTILASFSRRTAICAQSVSRQVRRTLRAENGACSRRGTVFAMDALLHIYIGYFPTRTYSTPSSCATFSNSAALWPMLIAQ